MEKITKNKVDLIFILRNYIYFPLLKDYTTEPRNRQDFLHFVGFFRPLQVLRFMYCSVFWVSSPLRISRTKRRNILGK